MSRTLALAYGTIAYAIFLGTFLYAIGFVGNFVVPTALDGPAAAPFWRSLAVDLGLLALFAVQHSLMARQGFKRLWTRIVPEPVERSTYVLFASLALIAMFAFWQPIGGVVWTVEDPMARAAIYAVFALGWGVVLVSTFLINHFDLFGLRQVWLHWRGVPYEPLGFRTPALYRRVRHPIYLGFILAFWATPTMTAAHLVFAVMTTAYILIAIQLEERDLLAFHGKAYADYRRQVRMLIPLRRAGRAGAAPSSTQPAQ